MDPADLDHELTAHARRVIDERQIDIAWLERAIRYPEPTAADRGDPTLRHAIGRVPERAGRYLRVVYNAKVTPWRIVTAFFDRRIQE